MRAQVRVLREHFVFVGLTEHWVHTPIPRTNLPRDDPRRSPISTTPVDFGRLATARQRVGDTMKNVVLPCSKRDHERVDCAGGG